MNERVPTSQSVCFEFFFFPQVQLVEGASGDWIPKMKEQFGVKTFDLVFLDHWKDRYLPDAKLMEASCHAHFPHITLLNSLPRHSDDTECCIFFFFFLGVWPPQKRQHPAGRQCHLPWDP